MLLTSTLKQKLHTKTTCKSFATIIVNIYIDGFPFIASQQQMYSFNHLKNIAYGQYCLWYLIVINQCNTNKGNVRNTSYTNVFYKLKRRQKHIRNKWLVCRYISAYIDIYDYTLLQLHRRKQSSIRSAKMHK